ncbi:beta-1,3-glucan-binding protein-like [Uranotaenia lowii]|uniref:beta-1,3-glucan-binding protein-like n=1 Tax=Uranotaenia lowii TaxID=190385 RepID=UPI002478C41F|nr:beta-1,3-glucan-binding protein-like [Uranotaenia lowii]
MSSSRALASVLLLVSVSGVCCRSQEFRSCKEPSVTTASGSSVKKSSFCPGELIFEDNFDRLNLENWQHEHTLHSRLKVPSAHGEFQYYLNSRRNSYVEDGILYLRPTLIADEFGEEFLKSGTISAHGGTPYDFCTNPSWNGCERTGTAEHYLNPIKSARLRTVNSFNFKYGKLEIRAKLPAGDWLWPALWLLPKLNQYGTWPISGEIDVMESRGNLNYSTPSGVQVGVEQIESTLHFGPTAQSNAWKTSTAAKHTERYNGFNKDFHLYQLEWTPEYMSFSIDGEQHLFVDGNFWERGNFEETAPGEDNPWKSGGKMAPFDEEFYITMNLAIGGTNGFFPDPPVLNNGKPKPWLNSSPTPVKDFWEAKDEWLPTWKLDENNSKEASLQVDYVRVWAL